MTDVGAAGCLRQIDERVIGFDAIAGGCQCYCYQQEEVDEPMILIQNSFVSTDSTFSFSHSSDSFIGEPVRLMEVAVTRIGKVNNATECMTQCDIILGMDMYNCV